MGVCVCVRDSTRFVFVLQSPQPVDVMPRVFLVIIGEFMPLKKLGAQGSNGANCPQLSGI